jgi:hypothetical protein
MWHGESIAVRLHLSISLCVYTNVLVCNKLLLSLDTAGLCMRNTNMKCPKKLQREDLEKRVDMQTERNWEGQASGTLETEASYCFTLALADLQLWETPQV